MGLGVSFNDDPVLSQLLVDQNYFLNTFNNEIASGIVRAFTQFGDLIVAFFIEPAVARSQHHWHEAEGHVIDFVDLIATHVLDIHEHRS